MRVEFWGLSSLSLMHEQRPANKVAVSEYMIGALSRWAKMHTNRTVHRNVVHDYKML